MISQLKQFVPSSVCLKCDGCCRFHLAESPWRPKTGQQENIAHTDNAGYINTSAVGGHHQCTFFNKADSTCGVYAKRPFECSLYPFVLSQGDKGLEVYMHWACPYIQQEQTSPKLEEYISYLKDFFNQPQTKDFLKENNRLLHDYRAFEQELKLLFTIEV